MNIVNKPVRNTLPYETLRSDEHQEFIDLANLLPAEAEGRATIVVDKSRPEAAGFVPETIDPDDADRDWYRVFPAMWTVIVDPAYYQAEFEKFLNHRFPVEHFPELRNYLKNGDLRRPELATPKQRWDWILVVSKALRALAETRGMLFPWAKVEDWKPTGACVVCNKLFSVTRRDKTTCSDACANIHYQRQWRERQRSGKRKDYYLAWKKRQAKKKGKTR